MDIFWSFIAAIHVNQLFWIFIPIWVIALCFCTSPVIQQNKKYIILLYTFIGLVLLVSVINSFIFDNIGQSTWKQYVGESISDLTKYSSANGDSYITGKVIIINTDKEKVNNSLQFLLPGDLRAKTPSEVGTIIFVTPEEEGNAHYTLGSTGYQANFNIQLFDVKRKTLSNSDEVYGRMPPETKKGFGDWHGPYPYFETIDHIKNLPVK